MSILPPRSSTGCFTCKCRRKKCDEAKPSCLRCQKSGLECPGYIYIQGKNKRVKKLRTLPAPREKKGKTQAQDPNQEPSSSTTESHAHELIRDEARTTEIPTDPLDFVLAQNSTELLGSWSNPVQEDNSAGSHFAPAVNQHWAPLLNSVNWPSPPADDNTSMTSGQASLLNALFSLGDSSSSLVSTTDTISLASTIDFPFPTGSAWPSPDKDDDSSSEEDDPEGAGQIICRPLALDKNAESNALPFVLQNYATWVARIAYEPLKMARLVRDFVIKQFEDGQESRWTLTLLANIGGRLGRGVLIDETHFAMISALQSQVRRRLEKVKMVGDGEMERRESVKVLDATLETIVIHFFSSPVSEWATLRKEAAPLFRRLCPEPPGSPINLPSILRQPDICLRHYVHIDVLCSTMMDTSMLFRYDCTPQNAQPPCEPVGEAEFDTGAQWLHGTPDRFVAMFAKINAMREDGWVPPPEVVAVFERGIQEFQPPQSQSCDSFLSVTRLVVQECWRQVAYVYLYMGLCGDSSDTPRVKKAFKQFMKLLNGTKPGRMPDEFLVMNLILIAPAAQKKRDREIMRNRIQGLRVNGPNHGVNDNMSIVENYWAHADAEGRPIMWSDIAQTRRRVVGM